MAALQSSFSHYEPILELNVFDGGSRASILFENVADAESFVEDMTLFFHGPLFIPAYHLVPVWGPTSVKVAIER